ncbi:hypothetical protein KY359_04545 [Candidatus Woesearchaeota archaeon]|nr:hypothetical protein [Candidatus Woesearchaeota archaeon]
MVYVDFIELFEELKTLDEKRYLANRLARHAGMDEAEAETAVKGLERRSFFWMKPGVIDEFSQEVMQRGGFDANYMVGVLGQVFAQYGKERCYELFREAGWVASSESGTAYQPEGVVFNSEGFPARSRAADPQTGDELLDILSELENTR